jgi:hypothetical protein
MAIERKGLPRLHTAQELDLSANIRLMTTGRTTKATFGYQLLSGNSVDVRPSCPMSSSWFCWFGT